MAHINLTLVVACALVDADKRVLIAQRPEGKTLAGLWEFPGGKIEPGERPEADADPRTARGNRHHRAAKPASRRSPLPATPMMIFIC